MRNLVLVSTAALALAGAAQAQPPPAAAGQPTGSFEQSCRNIHVDRGQVSAECLDTHGQYRLSTLPFAGCRSGVSNNNGVLYCVGEVASAGPYVGPGPGRGGPPPGPPPEIYAQGYSYPAYGDPHYGDPRFDPRYGPDGWGYGHRPGEWVWIRDRVNWLNMRIDHGVMDGALGRREAADLHGQAMALVQLEDSYRRQGMAQGMRADLDKRFDVLAARVLGAERNHGRPPPPRS